jgi:hypothetical protein
MVQQGAIVEDDHGGEPFGRPVIMNLHEKAFHTVEVHLVISLLPGLQAYALVTYAHVLVEKTISGKLCHRYHNSFFFPCTRFHPATHSIDYTVRSVFLGISQTYFPSGIAAEGGVFEMVK